MNRELIVNVNPTEISIALCEDKVLVELNKEQCQTGFAVGDIYLGKVRKIMPGLNAAFVNIGHEKDAFIHYLDLGGQFPSLQKLVASQQPGKRGLRVESMKLEPPVEKSGKIGDYLQVGQNIMVQIAKEAISTKGPRLTADISLAGRNVVLVPFSSKVFLSQKIRSVDEKKRLKRIAAAVLPKNFGVIIRTAAMEAKDEDIEHDIQTQIDRWRKTCAAIKKSTAPAQLMSEMNRANTIIRDSLNGSFSQIAVDDEAMYNDIRGYIRQIEPEKEKIVKLYRGNVPIFDNFDISKQIKSLFAKYVSLRRGAYLIIEHTEAMNVIDVNSGNRTKAEVRPVAVEEVSDVCPTCNGSGKIEPTVLLDKKIENQISFLTQDRGHKYIKLVVSPYVASFLKQGLWSLRRRWQWKYKVRLHVVADQSLGIVEVHYHDRKDNDLINK